MNNGGPAFPVQVDVGTFAAGVTVRDYFAAAALSGLLAGIDRDTLISEACEDAYRYADAMLAERAKATL